MAKTLDEFKARHDSTTIIAKLETELKTAKDQLGMQGVVRDVLGTAALQLDALNPPAWVTRASKAGSPGVPTLFLSDLHWGEEVKAAQVNGVNSFSLSIAHKRLKYTVDTAVHLLRILDPQKRYPGIVVALGGDMISGDIHDELAATNQLPTIPTVIDLYEQLCSALRQFADEFGAVFVPCVSGNHGRNTKKIWAKDRNHTSFDWMLYQFLARHFKDDPRVTFYVPEGSDALYRVYNTAYLLTHGDQFKAGDSIIGPLGPLMRGNQKKTARQAAVEQPYDVMICGHWHTYIHLERLIVNGSLKGYDEYAYQGNFGFEPPRQALWVTHPKYGINWRMPVLCEEPKVVKQSAWVSVPGVK